MLKRKKDHKFVQFFIRQDYIGINTSHYLYYNTKIMAENERDIVFSESVKAGKRIYYFDVKETRNGEKFLTITESKKIVDGGDAQNNQFTFQKHKIFLYKEDYEKFMAALQKTIDVAKGTVPEAIQTSYSETNIDIDLDF